MFQNLFDALGKEVPLFDAALEFRFPLGGDGIGFALAAFADEFGSAFEPAELFHFCQMRVEPPVGGLEHSTGQVSELLSNAVPVHCAATLKESQNQQIHMPLHHLTIQTLFFHRH